MTAALEEAIVTVLQNPPLFAAIAGAGLAVSWAFAPPSPSQGRDPARMFPAAVRKAGFDRAGHRCEMGLLLRCRARAAHGDHFIPWASGGSSGAQNFVAACAAHNLAKSSKMPSRLERYVIEARRRRYFPSGAQRRAGQRAHERASV